MSESAPQREMLAILDEAPVGSIHRWLWSLSIGGTLLDGFAVFTLGVVMPLVVADFQISPSGVGLIGSALVLGAVFGAIAGGPAADRFGRKPLLVGDMIVLTIGACLSAFAMHPAELFVGQLIVGVGIGIDFPVSATYLSEIMPKRERARIMVATIACQSIGMLLAAAFSIAVLEYGPSTAAWRIFLEGEGCIAALFLVVRLPAPESPRWSMGKGDSNTAAEVIARIAPDARARLQTLAANCGEEADSAVDRKTAGGSAGVSLLLSQPYRSRTILAAVPWFLMDIATYGVALFTPEILGAIGVSEHASGALAKDLIDAKGSAAIDLFLLLGFLAGLWAVPRFGRIRMQTAGFLGMTGGMLILLFATHQGASHNLVIVFAGFILFNLSMNAGPNATTFTLPPELFPTSLRASASGFAASTAKLGAVVGVFLLPILKANYGVPSALMMVAGVSFLGYAVTRRFAGTVTEAKSLEEYHEAAPGRTRAA